MVCRYYLQSRIKAGMIFYLQVPYSSYPLTLLDRAKSPVPMVPLGAISILQGRGSRERFDLVKSTISIVVKTRKRFLELA
jgi:hypothetical protein